MKEKSGPSTDKVYFPLQTQPAPLSDSKKSKQFKQFTDCQTNICRYTAVLRCLKSIAISLGKVCLLLYLMRWRPNI